MDLVKNKILIKKELSPNCKKKFFPKKDNQSPSKDDDKCPICLVIPIDRKSFANRCFHSFCKVCILEWAKVRTDCPLCRQPFDRLIYDVKSEYDFKELSKEDLIKIRFKSTINTNNSVPISPFYSPMLEVRMRNAYAQSIILRDQIENRVYQPGTIEHRRFIYATDLYVLPNSSMSYRRDASARFFRSNPACKHRLIPFLNLELRALIHEESTRQVLFETILRSLSLFDINSGKFQQLISHYTIQRTVHFIHEFYNFAISRTEGIETYFANAVYVPRMQTTVVQINYNDTIDSNFDLSNPYNYRTDPRTIAHNINHYIDPFTPTTTGPSNMTTRNEPNESDRRIIRNRPPIEVQELDESSDDSDIEFVFEGKLDTPSKARSSKKSNTRDDEPKPSTSGLQNSNRLSAVSNQTHYDSDSDYEDDAYSRYNSRSETVFDENAARSSSDRFDDDNENSIEYVGYLRPKRLRTPDSNIELIELTDDEQQSNDSRSNDFKKIKNSHSNEQKDEKQAFINEIRTGLNEKAVNCRCKVMCKYVCKKED